MALDSESVKSNVSSMTADVGMGLQMAAPSRQNSTDARQELIDRLAEAIVAVVDDLPWYVSWAINEKWVSRMLSTVVRVVDQKLAEWLG